MRLSKRYRPAKHLGQTLHRSQEGDVKNTGYTKRGIPPQSGTAAGWLDEAGGNTESPIFVPRLCFKIPIYPYGDRCMYPAERDGHYVWVEKC